MEFQDIGLTGGIGKFNYRDLIIFLIPFILFMIYLSVFNPGIATIDTFNQFHQIASGHFTNWHPFFHTLIDMLCLKVYPSPISICILQIFVFSTIWMIICKYNRKDDIESKNNFILQVIFTLFIAVIPINALYSISLWKDILFSYSLLFLCFLAKVLIDKQGNVSYKFIILLSLVLACVSQLRGNGFYVVLVVLIIYAIYLYVKKNSKMSMLLAILTITFILLFASLNIAFDVEDNEKDALMTKTAHMLADYDLNLDMGFADREKVHELIDKDKLNESYHISGSDDIYAITNQKAFENDKGTYISLALKYSLSNPLHFLQYLFGSSPMVWDITRDGDWLGRPFYIKEKYDVLAHDFEKYYTKHNYTATESYENISFANWGTPTFNALNSFALGIEKNVIADTLLDSPALYLYLSLILLVGIHLITKSKEIYLIYIPNLLNVLVVFLSTPIQDNRYLYANILICYLLIVIFMGIWQRSRDKSQISPRNP